ncbi:MAG TPA: hemolysin III family protein [Pirellulales bacterium]|jgi:hemolysin III|nr:hemolysin III family protein [Pirellulales bacterium]
MVHGSTVTQPLDSNSVQTPGELLNLLTHGLGLMLSLVAFDRMVAALAHAQNRRCVAGCIVYVVSLVAVYAASTLSHSFRRPRLRHFFRTVDQVCIFFLIAGTYTPWGVTFYSEGWGWTLLIAMWALAFAGAAFKLFVTGLDNVGVAFYVLLGWLPALAAIEIATRVPAAALGWLVAGGLCYTLGTFFLSRDDRRSYFHAIWHLMVIAGSACHFYGIMRYVVPFC